MEKLIAQAKAAGHDLSKFAEKKHQVVQAVEVASTRQLPAYYEAEALLLALEKPARFMYKTCKREECQEPFGTNYRGVGYCSDNCRAKALEKIGIRWTPGKNPEDRWGGEPPLILPPAVVKLLAQQLAFLLQSSSEEEKLSSESAESVKIVQDDPHSTNPHELPSLEFPIKLNMGSLFFDA
jgi:hypothetical protein